MTAAQFNTALRRDRQTVMAALVILTALAWGAMLWLTRDMAMPDVSPATSGMDAAIKPDILRWTAWGFLCNFIMWALMMAGMMTPTVTPMILAYARLGR